MTRIGFVGLGVMGGRMVKRLMDAGYAVVGYNRTKSKAQWLIDAGMAWADSPREVAERADVIFTMVTDTRALDAVTQGPNGILAGLGPGKVYIDMSTVSPTYSRQLAQAVTERGAHMLDAPVSGSVETLEKGQLAIMVGGDKAVFEKVEPILKAIGPKITYMGPNGSAVAMKVAVNLNLGVQMLAFCEAVVMAEKFGIPKETAVEALLKSVAASPMLQYRGPFVLNMPEEAWFNVNMMQKDLVLALELGRELDVPLPTTAVTNEFLTAARGMGLADKDFAIVYEVIARMAGQIKEPS